MADPTELAETEAWLRSEGWSPRTRIRLAAFLAEYDRRGSELAEAREESDENVDVMSALRRQRDAVLAIADDLDRGAPARPSAPDLAARLRDALGVET
jgi:hypothetical protein